MRQFSTLLNQFLQLIPQNEFNKAVKDLKSDRYVKHFKAWNLLTVLMIAQAKGQDSLRHIVTSLHHYQNTWSHLGLKRLSKSTLAECNRRVSPVLFKRLFYTLLKKTKNISHPHGSRSVSNSFRFKNPVYSMDSSTIDLCLSLFDWATFRRRKGAVKLHMLLDTRSQLPSVAIIKEGCLHDSQVSLELTKGLSPDSIVVFDKAYIHYAQFEAYQAQRLFFVTRSKINMSYTVIKDTGQHPVTDIKEAKGVILDQEIEVVTQKAIKKGPHSQTRRTMKLRLITYKGTVAK